MRRGDSRGNYIEAGKNVWFPGSCVSVCILYVASERGLKYDNPGG